MKNNRQTRRGIIVFGGVALLLISAALSVSYVSPKLVVTRIPMVINSLAYSQGGRILWASGFPPVDWAEPSPNIAPCVYTIECGKAKDGAAICTGAGPPGFGGFEYMGAEHNGDNIAIACTFGRIRVYNGRQRRVLADLNRLEQDPKVVCYSPDNEYLASAGPGELSIWNMRTLNLIAHCRARYLSTNLAWIGNHKLIYDGVRSIVVVNPDDPGSFRFLATSDQVRLIAGLGFRDSVAVWLAENGEVHMINVDSGVDRHVADSRSPVPERLASSDDGRYVAIAGPERPYESPRGPGRYLCQVLETRTWRTVATRMYSRLDITAITFAPHDQILAAGDAGGTVSEWRFVPGLFSGGSFAAFAQSRAKY